MSYICEFCGTRPENCICSADLIEPRLESELAVADNIMAAENPVIQRPYGLLDAPSPSDFFSLLMEMEREESKYDTPPSTPGCTTTFNLPPPPKLVRQTNRPPELCLTEEDIQDLTAELFPEEDEFLYPVYCEICQEYSCECDKMVPCDCGALYHIDEPYGMCFTCEMAERRQDLIDQQNYPDDIPDRYRYDSD
jgi:hypothetical protein